MPRVLVISGCALNCAEETLFAFKVAGGTGDIVNVNFVVSRPEIIGEYDILAIPGGFSYGDYAGAGSIFAIKVRMSFYEEVIKFIESGKLVIGICNGCQILARLFTDMHIAVLQNFPNARYICKWVDVEISSTYSVWLDGISKIRLPIAHGEGRFYSDDPTAFSNIVAMRYIGENPNGSTESAAAVTIADGRVLLMMPHPERAIYMRQRDDYMILRERGRRMSAILDEYGDGCMIFRNAIKYVA